MATKKPLLSEQRFFTGDAASASAMHGFLRADISKYEKGLRATSDAQLQKQGFARALALFQEAAVRVPAYKAFLKEHGINPGSIKTQADFATVPYTDKHNYISKCPLASRCFDGKISNSSLVAMSSGTSGAPTLWPRAPWADVEAALYHEFLYKGLFETDVKSTLFVIGFPMGVYVSGVATTVPTWMVSLKGQPITVASVGNNKDQVLAVVKAQAGFHDQVVLAGHPFFIKDVVETGAGAGIDWKKHHTKLMFCSEGFSEAWRSYIAGIVGEHAIFNTYGSSETLLIGSETLFTIAIRQALEADAVLARKMFGSELVPYLFQYDPRMRYVEMVGQELVYTTHSGTPLIRFNLHDAGHVYGYTEYRDKLKEAGVSVAKLPASWKLPVIALHGRSDYTMVFYAVNIYPQHIQHALDHSSLHKHLTGKFVMKKDYLKNMDQFFEVHVELRPGVKISNLLEKIISERVLSSLQKLNLEYVDASTHLQQDMRPRIVLRSYQDPTYFKPGLKPKYIHPS